MDMFCLQNEHNNKIDEYIILTDGVRACVRWICTKCNKKEWEICKKEIVENI